jgi:hypothetical protein
MFLGLKFTIQQQEQLCNSISACLIITATAAAAAAAAILAVAGGLC